MFRKILSNIQDKYNTIKKENEVSDQLLQKTSTFQKLFPIEVKNIEIPENKVFYITTNCPDINTEKAQQIAKLIPVQETYLEVFYTKELLTNQEYYLIPTNQYLWVISPTTYGAFSYNNLSLQIIKNNLMSKIILLSNILLEVNGTPSKIDTLQNIINHPQIRNKIIQEKTAYLEGITPTYQKINKLGTGLSLENNQTIVFHNKETSLKCSPKELTNYEILLDSQVYLSKNSATSKTISNFQTSCYQISIRVTTTQTFLIPILEPNTFGTKYNAHDSLFQTNLNFAKEIIHILNTLTKSTN